MNRKHAALASSLFVISSLQAAGDPIARDRLAAPCDEDVVSVKSSPYNAKGDGVTDDTAAIQAALNSARDVLVPAGTYLLSLDAAGAGLRLSRSGTNLILGPGAVLRLEDSQIAAGRQGQIVVVGDGELPVADVSIVGSGSIDGNRHANSGDVEVSAGIQISAGAADVVIRDITLSNVTGDAIFLRGRPLGRIARILIDGVHVKDSDEGILFKYADRVQIVGCRLENIDVQDGIEPHADSGDWVIANNTFDGVPNGQAIDPFNGCHHGIISSNTIRAAQQAMDLTSGGPWDPVTDILVEGNVIEGSTRESIYVPGNDAMTDTRIVIKDNIIDRSGLDGIHVGPQLLGIRIEGNQITNTVEHKGIFVDSGAQVDVIGNLVSGSGLHGIHHRGSMSLIQGNVVKNSSRALPGQFPAIQLDGGSRLTCVANSTYDDQITPTQYSGVWVRSSNSLVEHNSGFRNLGGLITDQRGSGTIIRENSGWATDRQGIAVFSGTGSKKDFSVAHGLVCAPDAVLFSAKSVDAAGVAYATADSAQIVIHFVSAPRAGTGNVSIAWRATCP